MDQSIETPLGRYRLIALLGQGGMADVYLACTQGPGGFQKLLVVKLARFIGDPMFSTMFLDEARLAAQLSHPNVVQTYEVGEEGSRHYIVMEYLDGANFARLRQRAAKRGGIPIRISLAILAQVLEGLDYAHGARGIDGKLLKVVHRDLTPSNVIITAQGVAKILDFGIAKGADTHSFTQTGRYSGKLNYMPPEQVRGERVDGRADIFSVGVILAEAALGERFWGTATGPMVASRLGQGELPTLEGTPLDPELRLICERALTPNREDRYPTAATFRADLIRYINTHGGPVDREELAQYVCEIVADDRTRLQSVIDTQLQRLTQLAFGPYAPPDLPRFEPTPNRGLNANDETDEVEISLENAVGEHQTTPARFKPAPAITGPMMAAQMPTKHPTPMPMPVLQSQPHQVPSLPPAPHRSRLVPIAIGGGIALVGGIAIATIARPRAAAPAPQPTPPPAASNPAPTPAPAPTPPVVATSIRIEVIVSPAEATLFLDGKSLGTNPYVGALPHDSQIHQLDVKADGYIPVARRFIADSDQTVQLRLDPVKQVAITPPEPPTIAHAQVKQVRGQHPIVHATTPVAPPVTAPPPTPPPTTAVTTTPPSTTTDPSKRSIDNDVYDQKSTKRSIDGNVY
ncbi:MAG TPA: serine/threonine-protein kinase, partial [Kofleriaceae bacterium]